MNLRTIPTIALIGLEALVAGCGFRDVRVSSSALTAYHDIKQAQIPDPFGHRHLLGPHEFIVPDKVMEVVSAYVGRPTPAGFFVDESFYNPAFLVKPFIAELQKAGYTEHDAWWYYGVLTTRGNIVIEEQIFQSPHFRGILVHERLHQRIPNLPRHEVDLLSDAYRNLQQRNIIPPVFFGEVKNVESNPINEFYPSLASLSYGFDTLLVIEIEETLAKLHPAAYKIYDRLRNEEKQRVGLME